MGYVVIQLFTLPSCNTHPTNSRPLPVLKVKLLKGYSIFIYATLSMPNFAAIYTPQDRFGHRIGYGIKGKQHVPCESTSHLAPQHEHAVRGRFVYRESRPVLLRPRRGGTTLGSSIAFHLR